MPLFTNHYRHDDCPVKPGVRWTDEWDCMCNDACPECGTKDIEPYRSEDEDGEITVHGDEEERLATDAEITLATKLTENQDQIVVHDDYRISTDEEGNRWFLAWVRLDDPEN